MYNEKEIQAKNKIKRNIYESELISTIDFYSVKHLFSNLRKTVEAESLN